MAVAAAAKAATDPDSSPVTDLLARHGAKLRLHGVRGSSYKEIAEELLQQLEIEKHRTSAVLSNLNAILNQYQVAAATLKQLQGAQESMIGKAQDSLRELAGTSADDLDDEADTDTKGK